MSERKEWGIGGVPGRLLLAGLTGVLVTALTAAPVWADDGIKKDKATKTEEAPAPESTKVEQDDTEVKLTAGWDGSHPYIQTSDGNFLMKFGGRMQLDFRGYNGSDAPVNSFFIRRARLEAEGRLYQFFEYKVQADFADTGGELLRDAFLNINYREDIQIKAGQFKAPFSQEELQSSKYIDFVERSSMGNLIPGRSPGVMVHGSVSGGAFEYAIGAFNGQGVLGEATASRPETFLRLRTTLWKSDAGQFSIGGAIASGENGRGRSFRGRTSSRSFEFFDRVPVEGDVQRYNGEFWWTHNSFSLRGEYNQTMQARRGLGPMNTDLPVVVGKGFVFQTTYILTGEKKGLKGIDPDRNFRDGGGIGAWEVAARFERLQLDDRDIIAGNGSHATAITVGINWWLNKFVRYQANLALEQFSDPARSPEPGDTDHIAFLTRIQVIF